MATTFPSGGGTDLQDFPAITINPQNIKSISGLKDSDFPYVITKGFHAGYFDRSLYTKDTLDGYGGVGLNPYGLYGITYTELGSIPRFLLTAQDFSTSSWGDSFAGEFRVGDNIKEDNGTLVGKNWLRFTPRFGFELSGPMLRSTSSDVNIIQSPGFDNITEFTLIGDVETETSTGYQGDSIKFTGDGTLLVSGYKTVDGASTIRGSILYNSTADFNGTVKVSTKLYNVDKVQIGRSNSIINIVIAEEWKRFNFVVRLDAADTFELLIEVVDSTAGTLLLDNWSAYKVFQSGFSSEDIPESLPPSYGVVIDRSGVRGYDSELTKNFELSAANGNAYLKGSLLVNGYVHTGNIYNSDGAETINPLEVEYYSGCGINEYGAYGIKATLDGDEHSSSTAKFLLSAKDYSPTDDYYWGTGFNQGEFRVGDDVAKTSATTLRGDKYLWFDGTDFRLKGVDIELSSGNYLWVGTAVSDGCGISDSGIMSAQYSIPKFIIAAQDLDDTYWSNVGIGDLRIGSNVKTLAGTVLEFDNSERALNLRGTLELKGSAYIKLSSATPEETSSTYIDYTGMSFFGADGNMKMALVSKDNSVSGGVNPGFVIAEDASTALSDTNKGISFLDDILEIYSDNFSIDSAGDVLISGSLYLDTYNYWLDTGEFRIGSSSKYILFDSTVITANVDNFIVNGINANASGTVIGDNSTSLSNLSLTGILSLSGTVTDGVPSSYIGIHDATSGNSTYVSKDGIAIQAADKWQGFLLGADHDFANGTSGVFYVGTDFEDAVNPLGLSHIYFDGSDLDIMINGEEVINFGSDYNGFTGSDWPDANATQGALWSLADEGISNIPAFLTASTATIPADELIANALNITNDYLGYVNSSGAWQAYIRNNGQFYFGDGGSHAIYWDSTDLVVLGGIISNFSMTGTSYVKNDLYVGDSSSGIHINGSDAIPYIESYNPSTSPGSTGWHLDQGGNAYINTIYGYGNNIKVCSYKAKDGTTTNYYGCFDLIGGSSDGAAVINVVDVSGGTESGLTVYKDQIILGCDSRSGSGVGIGYCTYLNLGVGDPDTINIAQNSTGDINIGNSHGAGNIGILGDIVGMSGTQVWMGGTSGDKVYIGGASTTTEIGFFGTTNVQIDGSTIATVADLVAALQNYGLLS